MKNDENIFSKLTRLFKSGPVVKRKIKGIDTRTLASPEKSSGNLLFSKSVSPTYSYITGNAYNTRERLMRYQDFQEMESTPEISAALDIYADETCAQDEKGRSLHIYSENNRIKKILEGLFYDTLNVEFNLRPWARSLCKFGDLFLYNDIHPDYGVMNVIPIPINEIERIEGYDQTDPMAVKFRWVGQYNKELANWEITHMRLLGNDVFLPYGSSTIESARKIWRQLTLIEDAMLVYRIVRAPERRVFYVDVGNLPPESVPTYLEQLKTSVRSNQVIDKDTGRVDLRYNPMSVDEDYWLATRGNDSPTKIETLAGGQNTAAVEDVIYIQKKLFAALKIPRAYLGYDELLSSKATLAQEDIRFSRTINMIQRTILSELNKIAIIHLYCSGFDGEELLNFNLKLSNPSTIAQQQKLEIYRTKFEIASAVPAGLLSKNYIYKNIFMLNDDEIENLNQEIADDTIRTSNLEKLSSSLEQEEPEEKSKKEDNDIEVQDSSDDELDIDKVLPKDENEQSDYMKKMLYNRGRRRTHGASKTHMPDFNKMTGNNTKSMSDPYDTEWIKSLATNPLGEDVSKTTAIKPILSRDILNCLRDIDRNVVKPNKGMLTEEIHDEELELELSDDI